jgi:replication factor A1
MTTDEWQGRFSVKMNRTTRISELDEDIGTPDREAQLVTIDSINESNKWINLRAKVVQLWDSEHESIDQIGLIGDETGTIKFVKWTKSELAPLEEGKSYSFDSLTTDEFEERFSVKFNKGSSIEGRGYRGRVHHNRVHRRHGSHKRQFRSDPAVPDLQPRAHERDVHGTWERGRHL